MANIQSQKKRNRQNEKNRIRNSKVRSSIRTASKKIVRILESREEKEPKVLNELLVQFYKTIDSAAQKGVVHARTAARKKSRLAKRISAVTQQQS